MLERKIKIIILIFNLFNPHLWVCLLILEIERKGEREMERERERERERENQQLAASYRHPFGAWDASPTNSASQPGKKF